jgi:Domain of unknown function (DUF4186)
MNETTPASVNISCRKTDCDNGLHCYRPKPTGKAWIEPSGECQGCGDRSVDWDRVKRRNIADGAALQRELQREWIRHHFWTKPIDSDSKEVLLSLSKEDLRSHIRKELAKGVAPPRPWGDGRRVPTKDEKLRGRPLYYAQHATASCCKKCAYYWWGLPRDQQYTQQQLDFLTAMCVGFFECRGLLRNE